ncbi:methylated-DNA--[protein]-cysteine S-methyltransferase [Paraclostridium sordellii]|uniref:methylated-DNA--[protein]-cysteine S-methyltransferase n=1 Tax=Paraclostridium sordellii TaxID=1505 RepID=UPI0003868674|nr:MULTISPECIES: methylated-DNA--[protein]-cysteine S-methyltransferase [Paeniclostridium]EPZ56927.1 methylated-DNA-[]-cysteine S-methyltransferase family protein [[Clostridium] sordellii VPI 9048] [Paeniclostridium sordellii VPI 9048]MBW4863171.1 methylated-DNA--[protein]-cysteine S-methyltransferase [Paeniclostridium sp.]MBW4872696.1 methylated-DNA--[protein]-cysteine S-methyltransferase [Paeniclostridium sp.]MCH1966746.1 methylated-DNA--[protein]-cysteine S-methyltransferase [Paeniclostridiu
MIQKYYYYYDSPIGILEIGTTEDELISILYVDEKRKNTEQPEILKETIKQIQEYFNGTRKEFDIKFKLKGTEFQEKVWNALTDIPYGDTVSYKYIATKIGNEKAVRAVGNTNGRNIINIVVPCHRVIGANKSLTGYGGGLDKKSWLLKHEEKFSKAK